MESVKQPMIDLMLDVINGNPPICIRADDRPQMARLANQLVDGGYLDGRTVKDSTGRPYQVAIHDVTIAGRRLCQDLEDELNASRLSAKAGRAVRKGSILLLSGFCGIIGGIIGAVATQLVLTKLNLQ